MQTPAEIYTPASRTYGGLPELDYPFHDKDVLVTACGRICVHRKKINVSTVLAGQRLGIKEVDEGIWLVSFMRYEDPATHRQPVRHEVVTHVLGTNRYLCLRVGQRTNGGERGIRTPETVSRLHAFQACAFDHSATSPGPGEISMRRGALQERNGRSRPPPCPLGARRGTVSRAKRICGAPPLLRSGRPRAETARSAPAALIMRPHSGSTAHGQIARSIRSWFSADLEIF
jgi:hypothetical protein